jgi:hypothetical protein
MDFLPSPSKSTKNSDLSAGQTLLLVGLAAIATILIGAIPWLGLVNYSLRLLITMVHELGHGLAAIVTGGDFIRFVVFADGSGLAYTAGGWRFMVIPAGYLGAALFGAGLIMLGRSSRWSRIAMGLVGLAMIILSLWYGTPTIFSGQIAGGVLTTLSGVIFGGLFLFVALRASARWVIFLLHMIAIRAGLTALSDIITVIGLSANLFGPARSDAQSMAELTFIPAIIWAGLWVILAMLLVGGAIWFTWLRSTNGEYTWRISRRFTET